jgi:hypothetical protein
MQNSDAIRANDLPQRLADRLNQSPGCASPQAIERLANKVRENLGIRLGVERMAAQNELLA